MILTDASLLEILNEITDTGNLFDPVTTFVGVGSAVANHGAATVLADVTQGTGAVATRVEVTAWGAPYKEADGRWVVQGPVCTFRPASGAEAQTVAVWFFATLAAAGVLKAFGNVAPPVNLVNEFSQFSIVPRIVVDPDGRWSAELTWNG